MRIVAPAAWGGILWLAGCGLAASPQPPTLWLPTPVRDLRAARVGDQVQLNWKMPRHTTDKVELRGPQRARICLMQWRGRNLVFKSTLCRAAGKGQFEPDKPAVFSVGLPPDLTQGPPRAVAFFVELESPAGKTAGPSNAAWAAAGAALPAATGLELRTVRNGVLLGWNKAAAEPGLTMRIRRTLVALPTAAKPDRKMGPPPVQEQTLEVDLSRGDPGGAVDHDASLDRTYRYTVQRVQRAVLDGRTVEIAGLPSQPGTIDAKDVFPPAVPADVLAVADELAHAIDLSWRPDADPDVAGYVVYRRDAAAGSSWERFSGPAPVVASSFEDHNIIAGQQYAYAVSAVDQDGNESARSAPVMEALPQS
jgi:hypothetical protein